MKNQLHSHTSLWQKANSLNSVGKKSEANEIYQHFSNITPNNPQEFLYKALSLFRMVVGNTLQNHENSITTFEAGIALYPHFSALETAYLNICGQKGWLDRSIDYLCPDGVDKRQFCELLSAKYPDDITRLHLTDWYLKNNYLELANVGIKDLSKNKEPVHLWRLVGLLSRHGRSDEANEIYQYLSNITPNNPQEFLYKALSLFRMVVGNTLQNHENSITTFEAGIALYPHFSALETAYLNICGQKGWLDRSIDYLCPDGVDKRQFCELLSAKYPDDITRLHLTDWYLKNNYLELANVGIKDLSKNKEPVHLWRLVGLLSRHGRSDEANEIYQYLSNITPNNPQEFLYKALSLFRMVVGNTLQNHENSITTFEAGIALYPHFSALETAYLNICGQKGWLDRSIDYLCPDGVDKRQFCELLSAKYPDDITRLHLTDWYLKNNYLELANVGIKDLSKNKEPVHLWRLVGLLSRHGRSDEANEIYQYLSNITPNNPQEFLYKALSLFRMVVGNTLQNHENSITTFEAGIALYPHFSALETAYLNICGQKGWLDRSIDYLCPDGVDKRQFCELLSAKYPDDITRLHLTDWYLKNNYLELANVGIKDLSKNKEPVHLWRLVGLLSRHGRSDEANEIYQYLSNITPNNPQEFLYKALSISRTHNYLMALDLLEQGCRKLLSSETLFKHYELSCALNSEYIRYSHFISSLSLKPRSPLSFYRLLLENNAYFEFIFNLSTIELECGSQSTDELKNEFIQHLEINGLNKERSIQMIMYGESLSNSPTFNNQVKTALLNFHQKNNDLENESYTYSMAQNLNIPMILMANEDTNLYIDKFINDCSTWLKSSVNLNDPVKEMTNMWAPWQNIFALANPERYTDSIKAFERFVFRLWPRLDFKISFPSERGGFIKKNSDRLRIGFIVLDNMPMMSGLLNHLDKSTFETIYIRPGMAGNSKIAKSWVDRADKVVEYPTDDLLEALNIIAKEKLDIIISAPSVPSIFFPMMSRLAPLQMVLLEPNWTSGLKNADYYISWKMAEPLNSTKYYGCAVAYLNHPPYWIENVATNNSSIGANDPKTVISSLLASKKNSHVYICANTPAKIHPSMDHVFHKIVNADNNAIIYFFRGNNPYSKTLKARLRKALGEDFYSRIVFLPGLAQAEAHAALQSADCVLDSFPICGMSSSFDAAMLGVPVVTMPSGIPFSNWTAAIYDYLDISGLTARTSEEYVEIALRLAKDKEWHKKLSEKLSANSLRYVENMECVDELEKFLIEAWSRWVSGKETRSWKNNKWEQ